MLRTQLLETDSAKYIAEVEHYYVPITGGLNTDIRLVREEKPQGETNTWEKVNEQIRMALPVLAENTE